jgi:topoisomerase-4 subunit A
MHGNNGSIDGDSAAAMRYTECRLSLYGQSLINNIKKNTVKFIDNFDGSESEPTVLPSLLPNVLINGASGIAAGYATNIPPFNPTEVIDAIIARIDSPNCHLDTIMKIMPAPDFPTGGFLVGTENMRSIYETGKGKITIRAKFELVNNKQAYITEIPFETTKSSIIRNIEELANTHDFLNINEVRDESDKNGVSICIEFKNSKNFDTIKNFLFKNTQLQISYGVNMVVIKDRKPHLMSILFFLDSFIEHVDRIIVAELKFDLEKAKSRREIVIGLIKAIKILDDVISLIRKSSDKANAKENLMNKMSFTEQQAEAIVTLRLYRLSNSDIEELNKELNELNNIIVELELLFSDKEHRNNYIKNKLREYKKIFASKRRSVLSKEDANIVIDQTDTIENVNRIIVVTRDGYLKSMSNASFSTSKIEELKLKDGDIPLKIFVSNLRDKIILISSKGKYISIPTFKIEQTK